MPVEKRSVSTQTDELVVFADFRRIEREADIKQIENDANIRQIEPDRTNWKKKLLSRHQTEH